MHFADELTRDLELPDGWMDAALENIGRLHCGQSPATRFVNTEGRGTPYVTGPDQWDGRQVRRDKWTTSPKRTVPDGCIFVTVKGAGVGTIFPGVAGAIGRDVYAFEPARNVDYHFVMHALELTVSEIKKHAAGDIPGLSRDHLLRHHIALPPHEEQKRIVETLRHLTAFVTAAQDRLASIPIILKRFRQAVLAAACSGRLTEEWRAKHLSSPVVATSLVDPDARIEQLPDEIDLPQSWQLSTLNRMVSEIQAGKNIRCIEHPPGRGQKGIVKISAVTWGEFLEDESKTLEDLTQFIPDRAIKTGDLLISRANTIDLVGACVLVRTIERSLMLSDKVLRLQVSNDWKRWVLFCLRSSSGRSQIENLATGNQLSMRNIKQESLRKIVIPLPPPEERDEIVRRVERLFDLADTIEKRVASATARADKLTQSILAKAFRGELVPTEAELARREGREYEPASVLLDRIRKERGTSSQGGGPARQKRQKASARSAATRTLAM